MRWISFAILAAFAALLAAADPVRTPLQYAPSPPDNPLKGLVPYRADVRAFFPHSLEFDYLPLGALVTGYGQYDWKPLEKLLDEVAGRGHQAVFRIYLEYPGKKNVIPTFLVKDGLKVHKYLYTETQPLPPAPIETPDYTDKNLRKVLVDFVRALGQKYDGDPRIGFITAGLLGTWGEWHTYPREDLMAKKDVQAEVLDAYEAAFAKTPVLLRYPAGDRDENQTPNAKRKFGYHDDSFAWGTLDTGKKDDDWFYLPALKRAGQPALDKWKTRPIGGEIRPEAWKVVFDAKATNAKVQDFDACVKQTHVTWLMDSGLFEKKPAAELVRRAAEKVRKMGYDFHVPAVAIGREGKSLAVTVEVENRGVAPFYSDWPVSFALAADGKVVREWKGAGKVTGLLPGDPARMWAETFDLGDTPPGTYRVLVRVANPLPKGHPIRFANETQDRDVVGWMTLGEVVVK